MVAMPLLGLLVLVQAESLRGPLFEAEAPLALAVRHADLPSPEHTSPTAAFAAHIGPTLVAPNEFGMRSFGVVVGCAALGVLVWLGARLFSVRTGVIAGVILISTPMGRSFLGSQFGVQPFYLLLLLGALSATRNLAIDKRSLTRASILGGLALALIGPAALWIPAMTLAWLRKLRGLTWRTFGLTMGTNFLVAILVSLVAALLTGTPLTFSIHIPPILETLPYSLVAAMELIPFLPIILLGLRNSPRHWRYHGSPNFLFLWTTLAGATLLIFGSLPALWVALAMGAGLATSWALARAEPSYRWAAIGAGLVLGIALGSFTSTNDRFDIDRWAVREAGKFVRRNLSADAAIAAPEAARARLSYYGSRPVSPLAPSSQELEGLDYVLLSRNETIATSEPEKPAGHPPREMTLYGKRLFVIAEFGSWMLARVERA